MSRILVTGGAGFIGSHVVDRYIDAGHEVTVVDDLSSGRKEFVNARARFHPIDIRSEALAEVFAEAKPEIVNHLAAQMDVRRSVTEPLFDADVNVLGGVRLLEQCRAHGVKKLIFASTGGAIYGEPAHLPAPEETEAAPLCQYGVSKYCLEQYIKLYHRLYGMTYTILRFPNVYGPRQSPHGEAGVCSILIGLMLEGRQPVLYGHGEPLRDYVYVGDIARGALLALEKGDNAIINLGSEVGTSVRQLFDHIAPLTGFTGEPRLEPLRAGEVARIYTTGARAAELLGWKPEVDLAEGLEQTAAYVRAAGLA
jgi:UDP-glucose 4-epimerase